MYICSKSCRDFMHDTAVSLYMTDFEIAWLTMIGETHPNQTEFIFLASRFNPNKNGKNTNKETLTWLELYAYDVAILVYKSQQLTIREESDEFGRYAQADMTNFMNNNLDFVLGTHECLTL
ncbi:unnamed protein product [Rotaria sp. Silwood1]|nr:unnamed protein product [Rotaria sp. Silwood1]